MKNKKKIDLISSGIGFALSSILAIRINQQIFASISYDSFVLLPVPDSDKGVFAFTWFAWIVSLVYFINKLLTYKYGE